MKAQDYLRKGAELLEQRGKDYDKPEGERSMGKCVRAFNAITGRDLSESEGWLLLQVLKDVRQWQNPGRFHADSAEDCISYAALKAESLACGTDQYIDKFDTFGQPLPLEPAAAMDDDSERMQAIGQNGNTGEHYDGAPRWDHAPDWAMWLAMDADGKWNWYNLKPKPMEEYSAWFYGESGSRNRHELASTVRCAADNWMNTLQARPTKES